MNDSSLTPEEAKNETISIISDLYKEIHGFRPRGVNFQEWSLDKLDSYYNELKNMKPSNQINQKSKMKISEFKKYLKEEIISILKEESADDIKDKTADTEELTAAQKALNQALEKTKELTSESTPLQNVKAETQKEMKSILSKFKKSEGEEKEKHLKRLKELTTIKTELEKLI